MPFNSRTLLSSVTPSFWLRWITLFAAVHSVTASPVTDVVKSSAVTPEHWKHSDIILSSRFFRDRPNRQMTELVNGVRVPIKLDTFEAVDAFFANRMEWVYLIDPGDDLLLTEAAKRNMKVGLSVNANAPDSPSVAFANQTYKFGRAKNIYNQPAGRVDFLASKLYQGCSHAPDFRTVWINNAKWALARNTNVVTSLQMDDVELNLNSMNVGACFCDPCNTDFRKYLASNFTAAQLLKMGVANVTTFSYRDYLISKGQDPVRFISAGSAELKAAYIDFQLQTTLEFYDYTHRVVTNSFPHPIHFAANTLNSRQSIIDRHDLLLREYKNSDPAAIYDTFVDNANSQGKPLLLTFHEGYSVEEHRRFAASCYAAGGNGIIPWDVYIPPTDFANPQVPRFYGTPQDFAPIFGFAKALGNYLDGYEDAGMFSTQRSDPRYPASPVIIEDNPSVCVFIRAKKDPLDPVVLHIIRKDPANTAPVTLTLNPDSFFGGPMKKTLYTMPAYNLATHNTARSTKNYSLLAANSTTTAMKDPSAMQIQIPAFDLWGVLVLEPAAGNLVQPAIRTPRVMIDPQQEVQIVNSGKGSIRYTLDGTEPGANSTLYTGPFTMVGAKVIKAKAFQGTAFSPTSTASIRAIPRFDIASNPSTKLWLRPGTDLAGLANNAPVSTWKPSVGPILTARAGPLPNLSSNTPPTFRTKGINSSPGVYFNGTNCISVATYMNTIGLSKAYTVLMTTVSDDPDFGLCANSVLGGGSVPRFYMTRGMFTYGDPAVMVPISSGNSAELTTVRMTPAGKIELFKNGNKVGSITSPVAPTLGGGAFAVPYGKSNKVPAGTLGEVIVFNRALTDAELESIHLVRQREFDAATKLFAPPVMAPVADATVNELSTLAIQLSVTDADSPAASLNYSLTMAPSGMTISQTGRITWTPTASQGPSTNVVIARVVDPATPLLAAWREFKVVVRDSTAGPATPVMAPVADATVNELSTLVIQLSVTDTDSPANTLTYSLTTAPVGMTVSPTGRITWTPGSAQAPSTNVVVAKVTDSGTPPLSASRQFQVVVLEAAPTPPPASRTVWQIGTDSPATTLPTQTYSEFSDQNNVNDLPPGRVTRLPGDPQYLATANPGADDDFYFRGNYPTGFNALKAPLTVPNDEPPSAWERNHTIGDQTNRVHFPLEASQTGATDRLRLTTEFSYGGSTVGGVVQPGFGVHDFVIRFRNGAGVATTLYSGRISTATNITLEFTAVSVQATAGPNTVELVRTGPASTGTSYWLTYDFLRLEALSDSTGTPNTPPEFGVMPALSAEKGIPFTAQILATDLETPSTGLLFELVSGPAGLSISSGGLINWTPGAALAVGSYSATVRVTDTGNPPLSIARVFPIAVRDPALIRSLWQIGTDEPADTLGYLTYTELGPQNNRNDPAPGQVTRLPGDPQYNSTTNPRPDDDFYFAGIYPPGFNGLLASLNVPKDEPSSAWERSLTLGDRTNRLHFILDGTQVTAGDGLRLTVELSYAGSSIAGVVQPGFATHDVVVRFRNGSGVLTQIYSGRISQATTITLEIPVAQVAALAGPNSIEVVRSGPEVLGTSYWLTFDHVRLEALPTLTAASIRLSGNPRSATLSAAASPAGQHTLAGLVGNGGELRRGLVHVNGSEYLTVTYSRPDPLPPGVAYVVESSQDLVHWSTDGITLTGNSSSDGWRTLTLQDGEPLGGPSSRFMRLRIAATDLSGAPVGASPY